MFVLIRLVKPTFGSAVASGSGSPAYSEAACSEAAFDESFVSSDFTYSLVYWSLSKFYAAWFLSSIILRRRSSNFWDKEPRLDLALFTTVSLTSMFLRFSLKLL